ncbi:MAG: hypothetical protein ACYDDU_21190 [Dermatophilaceae bacterium]
MLGPRRGRARRHPVRYVLAVLVAAFSSAGFASLTGAAQWVAVVELEAVIAAWTAANINATEALASQRDRGVGLSSGAGRGGSGAGRGDDCVVGVPGWG